MLPPDLRELYARSRELVAPGEEDFGITMVEALASGKPVLAFGRGGACEIVPLLTQGRGGFLYANPCEQDLEDALTHFEIFEHEFQPKALQRWAAQFSEAAFRTKMQRILEEPQAAVNPVAEPVPVPFA